MGRILFCTDTYPPQLNGVSVVTAAMVEGLNARGWQCAVLAPSYPLAGRRVLWSPEGAERFTIPSITLPSYPEVRLAWPDKRKVQGVFETFRPDIVHCATEFTAGWTGLHEARRRGLPVCTTSHTDFSRYCSAYGMPFLKPVVRRWLRYFHTQAARTLVPSRSAQEDLRRLGLSRTHVWSGGVDAELFHPRHFSSALRQRLGVGRAFTFLHVGRLAPEKNVELVLSAFALLRVQLPDAPLRLIVAGTGPAERHLRSLATPGVTFLGAIDRTSELPALYASVDAFMTASVTETLGLVGLEAMASGLPVVASPAGGIRDYLEHARNGLT
jgi:glycosyltransferase involved in cell wall biosynthesis